MPKPPAQYREGLKCQGCGSPALEDVLDLGHQPLCNDYWPSDKAIGPQTYYPLRLCRCSQCTLVQLDHIIPTEAAFGQQYTYLTGSSRSLVDYYSALAARLTKKYGLKPGDTVVEIGSNDGTFLKAFQELGLNVLGVEGAAQAAEVALRSGIPTVERFFGKGVSEVVRERLPQAPNIRLITAMNVLAHTDNIGEFLPEVVALMQPGAVFVSSSHWLVELVRKFEFDTIYHEHLRYYTLGSLMNLFSRHGLHLTDGEVTDFYGGSIMAYATTEKSEPSPAVKSILQEEAELDVVDALAGMKGVLLDNKARLLSLLVELKNSGKRVVGIGAPMKASTLLNYYGITSDLLEYTVEVNELKVGTSVPGAGVPVVHEEIIFRDPPDYAMVLSWNMAEIIMGKYREMGYKGKFILPVPKVEVVDG